MATTPRAFDRAALILRRLGPVGVVPARAVRFYGQGLATAERLALQLLRSRMQAVVPPVPQLERRPELAGASPAEVMTRLLSRSLEQNTAVGQTDYYLAVLRQLVPDEARIIAGLAENGPAPLVSVYRRGSKDVVLRNASLIGRRAAVTVPSMTPQYVARLLRLGLVELGPEDSNDDRGYELVLAEKDVREALKAGEMGKLPARVERRTVRLSAHGRDLWATVRPDSGVVE